MSFTIVVPYYNGQRYLNRLFNSIPESIPIVLVDDKSAYPPNVKRPNVQVLSPAKKGYFTGASNRGIEACDTDVLILNQDTYFTGNDWLNFIDQKRKRYGIFGERAGNHPAWPKRYVHGTFMYIGRDVIKKIGLMNEENYPHWGSTCEYQLRACRRGFKALPVEKVPDFVHVRRGSFGSATRQVLATDKQSLLIRTPPYISVIITCYNYGRYLNDAVHSLIGGKTSMGRTQGQTFQGFEIIIVDDGSEDDSAEIGRKLANPWKGIHFVSQANGGSAAAMNAGIEASHARSGHLIAPLDGDDMMKPDRLARLARVCEDNPHSVAYDNLQYFAYGKEGVVQNWETGKRYETLNLGTYNFEEIIHKNTMHKGLMYPKRAWEEVGGYPEEMKEGREDWAFNVGLGIKGWCGINTGEFDYLYRREMQNRTLTNTTPRWRSRFLSQLKEIYPEIYRGERPVGCCGGGKKQPGSRTGGAAMAGKRSLPGVKGMVILEYNGGNSGDEHWRGPITNTVYVLGGVRKQGYVDIRDANGDKSKGIDGMLDIVEKGRVVFKEAKRKKKKASPKPKLPTVLDVVTIDKSDGISPEEATGAASVLKQRQEEMGQRLGNVVNGVDLSYPNPDKMTVSEIKKAVLGLDRFQLEELLKAEQNGKARKSALGAIGAALNE
jgi:glycosyltransferase involved in cell wall biosynthesis